ncbi:hypothetical protein ALC57_03985 [Trachymyrmex cornetzi]|uniref:Uncharacterized protein n=1 Tax=Trachymyrmex cornetzi TaxID=471704 RepID=A0A151JM80_9HYME|nr:hypothetical protein ALC57_03985 [Trachymyrmex cornetzi]
MLDTRAQPNIIKAGSVNPRLKIDCTEKLQLTGITTDVVETLGSIKARILRVAVSFSGPYRIVEVLDHHNVRLRIRQATKSCI